MTKKVMKTHRKVPEKCNFSPFGLNCGSETAFQARNSGPQVGPPQVGSLHNAPAVIYIYNGSQFWKKMDLACF